jgi:sulfite reductase (NADPH) flavoprotein alpha-component
MQLLSVLRKLTQRLYSVASSPSEKTDVVDITVKLIENKAKGRVRNGICSSYVWHRLDVGDKVPVSIETIEKFRLPEHGDKAIIMIGAGTGIAPYRGFLQERKSQEGNNWLIFGERNKATDYLYQNELDDYYKDGTLTKLSTAFSRDQKDKFYVSDVILSEADELLQWIENGAIVYVCGSKDKLAKSVRKSLLEIFSKNGLSSKAATAKFAELKASKRYMEEVY